MCVAPTCMKWKKVSIVGTELHTSIRNSKEWEEGGGGGGRCKITNNIVKKMATSCILGSFVERGHLYCIYYNMKKLVNNTKRKCHPFLMHNKFHVVKNCAIFWEPHSFWNDKSLCVVLHMNCFSLLFIFFGEVVQKSITE